MAAFGLAWALPSIFGPGAAGVILDYYNPNLLWYIGGGLCAIAALAFYALHLRLGAQVRFAPSEEEPEKLDDPAANPA
jgi:MFS family permease